VEEFSSITESATVPVYPQASYQQPSSPSIPGQAQWDEDPGCLCGTSFVTMIGIIIHRYFLPLLSRKEHRFATTHIEHLRSQKMSNVMGFGPARVAGM
jgi:hypothetical protein